MLGRFAVEGLIGRGGTGLVYKVRDLRSRMPYAAKVLNPAAVRDRDCVRRFKTEAKIAGRLTHMNVAHVLLIKKWKGTLYYVMEHVDGVPLDEMPPDEPLSFDRKLRIVRDVAAGLQYVHSKGYIHRDIKPGNVLVRTDAHVKLIDFGLAQKAGRVVRTKSGHVLGTAKYMAPELINGTWADPATDLYALGVMLYELVAGRAPFVADHTTVILDMHLYVKPRPLLEAVKGTDRSFSLVVDRMLVKDPARRAASARALHGWLDHYLSTGRFADPPAGL